MQATSRPRGPFAKRGRAVLKCLLLLVASVAGIFAAILVLPLAVVFGIGCSEDDDGDDAEAGPLERSLGSRLDGDGGLSFHLRPRGRSHGLN